MVVGVSCGWHVTVLAWVISSCSVLHKQHARTGKVCEEEDTVYLRQMENAGVDTTNIAPEEGVPICLYG